MKRLLFPALVCLTLISSANSLAAQPCRQAVAASSAGFQVPHIKLDAITFSGRTAVSLEELNAISGSLTERTYRDDSHWIEELRDRITDAWQHLGYLRVQIGDIRAESRAATGSETHFTVTAVVDAGQIYSLKEIGFGNASQFSASELRAMFPIADGELVDTHKLQEGMTGLRKAYGAKGFINITVVPAYTVDEANATVALDLDLSEGKQYTLSGIRILGLPPDTAQNLLQKSGLERGKIFSPQLLENFFEQSRSLLPQGANPLDDVQKSLDDQRATIDVTLDFSSCSPAR